MHYYTRDKHGTWLHFNGFCVKVAMQTSPTPFRISDDQAKRSGFLGTNLAFGEYIFLGVN